MTFEAKLLKGVGLNQYTKLLTKEKEDTIIQNTKRIHEVPANGIVRIRCT